jgi:hypothetical protein
MKKHIREMNWGAAMRPRVAVYPGLETLAGLHLSEKQLHALLVVPQDMDGNPLPVFPSLVHHFPSRFPHIALACRFCLNQRAERRKKRLYYAQTTAKQAPGRGGDPRRILGRSPDRR